MGRTTYDDPEAEKQYKDNEVPEEKTTQMSANDPPKGGVVTLPIKPGVDHLSPLMVRDPAKPGSPWKVYDRKDPWDKK